jgi:hypothetical protein
MGDGPLPMIERNPEVEKVKGITYRPYQNISQAYKIVDK